MGLRMTGVSQATDLVVFLPYPPTANNLFPTGKSGKRFVSAEYRAWKQHAGIALNPQLAGTALPLPPPYQVVYEFRRPDRRRRDAFNGEKALSDLLVAHGVITDDCLIEEGTVRWVTDVPWEVRATVRGLG